MKPTGRRFLIASFLVGAQPLTAHAGVVVRPAEGSSNASAPPSWATKKMAGRLEWGAGRALLKCGCSMQALPTDL